MMTLEEHKRRWYEWHRRATIATIEKMGLHANSPRTKQLQRIATRARKLYERAQQRHIDSLFVEYARTLDTKAYKRLERAYLKHTKKMPPMLALENALIDCELRNVFEVKV